MAFDSTGLTGSSDARLTARGRDGPGSSGPAPADAFLPPPPPLPPLFEDFFFFFGLVRSVVVVGGQASSMPNEHQGAH